MESDNMVDTQEVETFSYDNHGPMMDPDYTILDLDKQHIINNHDNDQTFLKTVAPTNLTPDRHCGNKGANSDDAMNCDGQSYTASPPIGEDGNIHCGQPQRANNMFTATMFDDDLYNLPKDTYISRLLENTYSSEELVSNYRSELATRAKRCENPPVGILKDRRKSPKCSIAEKYAQDCFMLNQFLSGNVSDINFLFKTQSQNLYQSVLDNSVSQTPRANADSHHDMNMLKHNVANLQSDVHLLKTEASETKRNISSLASNVNKELRIMKSELDTCTQVLIESFNIKDSELSPKFSNGLKVLTRQLKKLETSRNSLQLEINELSENVQSNSSSICNIRDCDEQRKNTMKMKVDEVNERIDQHIKTTEKCTKSVDQTFVKALDAKLKTMETKISQTSTNAQCNTIEKAFKSFTSEICTKFDSLNENLQNMLEKAITMNKNVCTSKPPLERPVENSPARHNSLYSANPQQSETGTSRTTRDLQDLQGHSSQSQQIISPEIITINDSPTNNVTGECSRSVEMNVPYRNRENHKFRGVIRKKAISYLITGIAQDSDQEGLEEFLEEMGIVYKSAKFLYTRRQDCQSVQIVVSDDQSTLLEDTSIWPEGVFCRPWLKRSDYRKRMSNPDTYDVID